MNKVVALVTFLFVWTLTTHGKYSAAGDEPHYLMITQSVVADPTSISRTTTPATTVDYSGTTTL